MGTPKSTGRSSKKSNPAFKPPRAQNTKAKGARVEKRAASTTPASLPLTPELLEALRNGNYQINPSLLTPSGGEATREVSSEQNSIDNEVFTKADPYKTGSDVEILGETVAKSPSREAHARKKSKNSGQNKTKSNTSKGNITKGNGTKKKQQEETPSQYLGRCLQEGKAVHEDEGTSQAPIRRRLRDQGYYTDDLRKVFKKMEASMRIAFLCTWNNELAQHVVTYHLKGVSGTEVTAIYRDAMTKCHNNVSTWKNRSLDNLAGHIRSLCRENPIFKKDTDQAYEHFVEAFDLATLDVIFEPIHRYIDIAKTEEKGVAWLKLCYCNFGVMMKLHLDMQDKRIPEDGEFSRQTILLKIKLFCRQEGAIDLIPSPEEFVPFKISEPKNKEKEPLQFKILGIPSSKDKEQADEPALSTADDGAQVEAGSGPGSGDEAVSGEEDETGDEAESAEDDDGIDDANRNAHGVPDEYDHDES